MGKSVKVIPQYYTARINESNRRERNNDMLLLVALFLRSVLCVSISAVCCSCHSRELGTRQTVLDIFFPQPPPLYFNDGNKGYYCYY